MRLQCLIDTGNTGLKMLPVDFGDGINSPVTNAIFMLGASFAEYRSGGIEDEGLIDSVLTVTSRMISGYRGGTPEGSEFRKLKAVYEILRNDLKRPEWMSQCDITAPENRKCTGIAVCVPGGFGSEENANTKLANYRCLFQTYKEVEDYYTECILPYLKSMYGDLRRNVGSYKTDMEKEKARRFNLILMETVCFMSFTCTMLNCGMDRTDIKRCLLTFNKDAALCMLAGSGMVKTVIVVDSPLRPAAEGYLKENGFNPLFDCREYTSSRSRLFSKEPGSRIIVLKYAESLENTLQDLTDSDRITAESVLLNRRLFSSVPAAELNKGVNMLMRHKTGVRYISTGMVPEESDNITVVDCNTPIVKRLEGRINTPSKQRIPDLIAAAIGIGEKNQNVCTEEMAVIAEIS